MGITKRNASLGDAAVLLEWRNSPSARKFSQNSELIKIEDHLEWFMERLERTRVEPFFMFELNHKLVGMSRLDFEFQSEDEFVISILVNPDQHSKGIGTKILDITCETIFNLHPNHAITAKIHQSNLISQKLFVNAGFELQNPVGDFLNFKKHFKSE
jgi:UDP-2,4-diacetamido-2,4,6-trideoxy-beta-L-altropyranose hydrolase